MADEAIEDSYRVEDRGDYLYIYQRGTLPSHDYMVAFQRAIEGAMRPELRGRVLFDNRDTTRSSEELRAAMWTWLTVTSAIRRAAVVAHSVRVKRRVDRTADLNRLAIQGFQTVDEAEAWLRQGY